MSLSVPPPVFPTLFARSLNGRSFTLPTDFEGERNLVIVAFRRWHQSLVDSWLPYLDQLQAAYPDLRVYELPVIDGGYVLARPFIDGGMALVSPSPLMRARTLTVYTDVRAATTALQIVSTLTISLLLVDRAGRIGWRDIDAYSPARAAGLELALKSR